MSIPAYSRVNLNKIIPLNSFNEYASACNVIKILEARLMSGNLSEHDKAEYYDLFGRVEYYEYVNRIKQ